MRSLSLFLLLAASAASAQNPARVLVTGDSLSTDARGLKYVQAGDTVRVDAKVYATNGARVADPRLTWTPTNANTKLVSAGPSYVRLTALQTGTVALKVVWLRNDAQRPSATASYQALVKTDTTFIAPARVSMVEGDSVLFTLTALDKAGRHITGRKPKWVNSDTAVATLRVVAADPMQVWVIAKKCGATCAGKLGFLRGSFYRLTWFTQDTTGALTRVGT